MDEITDISHALLTRFGLYRRTIAGEGAAFFLLADRPSGNDYARLDGMMTFYGPADIDEVKKQILSFLAAHAVDPDAIDLVITGNNGDAKGDDIDGAKRTAPYLIKTLTTLTKLRGHPTSDSLRLHGHKGDPVLASNDVN